MTATTLALIVLAHFVGDYVIQSHWMASMKTSNWIPAIIHATLYTGAYLMVTRSIPALAVIGVTHLLIDRFRLARHVVWVKNLMAPRSARLPWNLCSKTGYGPDVPPWLAVWLMIIVDNMIHLVINFCSILWLT